MTAVVECPIPFPGAEAAVRLPGGGWVLRRHHAEVEWDDPQSHDWACAGLIPRGPWPSFGCSRGTFHAAGWCVANVRRGKAVAIWPTQLCPDPWTHNRWYAGRESTWLKSSTERAADRANGCPWCGKPLPATKESAK